MTIPSTADGTAVSGDLYQRIQHFYARQTQLLDAGDVMSWVDTFTEDATFASNARTEPTVGRSAIIANVQKAVDDRVAKGLIRRHWLGMFAVTPHSDGELRVRCYAIVLAIPRNGQAGIHVSATCEDALVPVDGGWLVRERSLRHDDITPPASA